MKFPTETVDLPSKGLVYSTENPLSNGKVEMKYMTAYHEDILTNRNYIEQGIVLDKLLQELIVTKINYDDLILGDKNALIIAARILGYGKDYKFQYAGKEIVVDLSKIEPKEFKHENKGKNEFEFTLPHSGNKIVYKILTHRDEKEIQKELEGYKKINKVVPEMATRLKYMILSVEGKTDKKDIRDFVDNGFLAIDSKAFRSHLKETQPDIDLSFTFENEKGLEEKANIPININFFWPDL